jgi:diguanylate cyclase
MNKPKLNLMTFAHWQELLRRMGVAALLLMAAGLASLGHAAQPLVLEAGASEVQVWPAVSVLSDPQKNLSIEQVLNSKSEFKAPTTAYGTLGLRTDAVWLQIPFTVAPKAGGLWVLDVDYAAINRIDVYVVSGGKVTDKSLLGNLQPLEGRPVNSRAHSVGFTFKGGGNYELYLRVENVGSMILPVTLNAPAAFLSRALGEQMLQGLLTGLALCLLIYSLAQWVSLGEHLFVKYAILISGSLLFTLSQFGVGAQFVWPGNIWMVHHSGGLSALIAATGSFLFIQQALAGPDLKPWLSRLMTVGASLTTLSALVFAFDWIDVYQVTTIISILGLMPCVLGFPGALTRARRGDRVGIYFLLAWAVYLVSTAILIEVIKGRIGVNFWTMHSFQFGASIDMLLFMRVLGLRTKALQTAMQHATIERESLVTMANTDPLTGLPNRRSLNSSVSAAIQHAGPDKLLAVYMLDLDGFKQVNDQYGHDVGDELLVAVAGRLKANLRNSDVVSRLGGDEFLVMSTGLKSASQAQELGEKLVKAFSEPFILAAQTCSVGLTIGYALAPVDAHDSRTLLKRADAAMYAGKQDGKNCVRRGENSGA